jgi:hypothetical protein
MNIPLNKPGAHLAPPPGGFNFLLDELQLEKRLEKLTPPDVPDLRPPRLPEIFIEQLPGEEKRKAEPPEQKWMRDRSRSVLLRWRGAPLTGSMEGILTSGAVRWKADDAAAAAEFPIADVRSVIFAESPNKPSGPVLLDVLTLANGDWLPCSVLEAAADHIRLRTPWGEELKARREWVKAVYFGHNSSPVYLDGAHRWESWFDVNSALSDYRYSIPGAFRPAQWTYHNDRLMAAHDGRESGAGGLILTRQFGFLPPAVEMEFRVSNSKGPPTFMAFLCHENFRGAFLSFDSPQVTLADRRLPTRGMARGLSVNSQEILLPKTVDAEAFSHTFRILLDRKLGAMRLEVDCRKCGTLRPSTERAESPGSAVTFVFNGPVRSLTTLTAFRIAPWAGDVLSPLAADDDHPDILFLKNGDATTGVFAGASAASADFRFEDVNLSVPRERVRQVRLRATDAPPHGTKIRLRTGGCLTVQNAQVAGATVQADCPELSGAIRLPLEMVAEFDFPSLEAPWLEALEKQRQATKAEPPNRGSTPP